MSEKDKTQPDEAIDAKDAPSRSNRSRLLVYGAAIVLLISALVFVMFKIGFRSGDESSPGLRIENTVEEVLSSFFKALENDDPTSAQSLLDPSGFKGRSASEIKHGVETVFSVLFRDPLVKKFGEELKFGKFEIVKDEFISDGDLEKLNEIQKEDGFEVYSAGKYVKAKVEIIVPDGSEQVISEISLVVVDGRLYVKNMKFDSEKK